MEPKKLAFRFRDSQDGIDTIIEHQKIINKDRAVWWGWWKKDHETVHGDIIEFISKFNGDVSLVNRENKKLYTAHVDRIELTSTATDKKSSTRVPSYYRENSDNVYAWLLISSITEKKYNDAIDNLFSENENPTFIAYSGRTTRHTVKRNERTILDKNTFLFISDIHFGKDYAHNCHPNKNDLSSILENDLKYLALHDDIASIVISGDITSNGDWSDIQMSTAINELHALADKLHVSHQNIVVCPGNHDINRYTPNDPQYDIEQQSILNQQNTQHERNFRIFREDLNGRARPSPLNYLHDFFIPSMGVDVDLCVLNSCSITATKWTEYGYVGQAGLDVLTQYGTESASKKYRVAVLHHHLLPINDIEKLNSNGISMSIDAVDILKSAINNDVSTIIHGHQHLFNATEYSTYPRYQTPSKTKNIKILANGSIGVNSKRRVENERHCYIVMTFNEGDVEITAREITGPTSKGITINNFKDKYI